MFSTFSKQDQQTTTDPSSPKDAVSLESGWGLRLQQAIGDDAAVLALIGEIPSIELKIVAVQALVGEDALRLAEREFRTHDRRVHSVAKQCYEKCVAQRKARARADELIDEAMTVSAESMIPANRLVELDQAWRALDASLLDASQLTRFDAVQTRLVKQVRDSGERHRAISKWVIQARVALAQLNESIAQAADPARKLDELLGVMSAASAVARGGLDEVSVLVPEGSADSNFTVMLTNELSNSLNDAAAVEARLNVLVELGETQHVQPATGKTASTVNLDSLLARWNFQPPIEDSAIANALNFRFDSHLRELDRARQEKKSSSRQRSLEKNQIAQHARVEAYTKLINSAETALADGHVTEAVKQLPELQSALDRGDADTELQTKIAAVHGEIIRLKEWQRWGGGQVRQDLVEEAETLARSVTATEESKKTKTPVAQLEKYIVQLRARWKELDRLGGATGKPLWQRFDAALKAAELPVAAHKARLTEARQTNLAARESLLAELDLLLVVNDISGAPPDWKSVALALSRFQTEWRKLGPLEHTVPHKRLAALTKRMQESVQRIEAPLHEIRQAAQAEREILVARAKALGASPGERDIGSKIRALQQQWQMHSKSMPLPHSIERALWQDFKTAIDTVFKQKELAVKDRNAQLSAGQKAREALIAQLHALGPDTPVTDIKRIVAEVTAEWRKSGDVAKDKSARLEAKYREAQDAVRQLLAGSAQRKWQSVCDALVTKMTICKELETADNATESAIAEITSRWTTLSASVSPWDQVLQSRFDRGTQQHKDGTQMASGGRKANAESFDDLLLKLELALGIASPASAEGARRTLKLLAMKNALEGRKSVAPTPPDLAKLCNDAFGWANITADQSARLDAVISALRLAGPERLRSST